MDAVKQYYKNRAQRLIKAMNGRQIDAEYFETSAQALESVGRLIPDGSAVGFGGSRTVDQIGLKPLLSGKGCTILDKDSAKSAEEAEENYRKAFTGKFYVMSSNAITMDGQLVNIDGRGNRLAALIYGPANVYIIAGMNKVVETEEEAVSRVRNVAGPANANRLNRNTPCAVTGSCSDCQSDDCICCNTVVTRRSNKKGRIKVFLIGEELGF